MDARLVVSVECLGKTEDNGTKGRLYTCGPGHWSRHFSPLFGRIAGTKEPANGDAKSQKYE